jgi:diguanylate cyclase (GGDEF)-like protein
MGGPVQEVFQGRGEQKGKGLWLKRTIPLFFVISAWLGLLIDFPLKKPVLWFSLAVITIIIYSFLHLSSKRKDFSIEFLFSLALILSGTIKAFGFYWLKLIFFPFIITITAFYGLGTIIPLSLLIPFMELRTFLSRENLIEEGTFSAFLILTAIISPTILHKIRQEKERAVKSLETIKDSAKNIAHDTAMDSLSSERTISHYFASMLKTDEEIKELLITVKHAVFADSANFFVPQKDGFTLRCSSEEKINIIITGGGALSSCLKDKKLFYSPELNEKELDAGYIKDEKITSIIAVPVLDGSAAVGVFTVDSARYQAFSEPDRRTVQMFATHLIRILERERVYPKLKRDYSGLKILQEESSKLVSSLNTDVIVEKLCEGAKKIASSQALFFVAEGKNFRLMHDTGNSAADEKVFDLEGTFLNMIVENEQPIYMSDISSYRIPIVPFKTENIRSVISVPLIYENNLLGLFVMLSKKVDFLDTFQLELLKVMCNQASTSLANATLHEEIEKLATTDGLTGLYNHRLFQEKLSEEIRRLSRFSEPTSLLLIDIDHFKKINDTYGHPVGDLVLKSVSTIIKDTIRNIDIPARYGGEEFAAILPGTSEGGSKNMGERLRKAISKKSFTAGGNPFRVTVSIGMATSPDDAKTKEGLIAKADQALYYAKNNGRNQSVLWSSIK